MNENITDLVYSIEDKKLIALLQKKLIERMQNRYEYNDNTIDVTQDYWGFEDIRLNDHYGIDASGINFVYNQYEIASYAAGVIIIPFTYEELKQFVKKDSKLYYLFQ